jgi:hypothetical protein
VTDDPRIWKCGNCGHEWPEPPSGFHGPCPECGEREDIWTRQPLEATLSFAASLVPRLARVLDALGLTVIGLLLAVGLTVGFGVGFGIGGCIGAIAGPLSGIAFSLVLALAIRTRWTRNLLARVASWVLPPADRGG